MGGSVALPSRCRGILCAVLVDEVFASWGSWEGVPSAVAAARDGVDALLRDRGLRRTTPELTAESLLRGAHASAEVEAPGEGVAEMVEAAARLNAALLSQVPVIRRSPLQRSRACTRLPQRDNCRQTNWVGRWLQAVPPQGSKLLGAPSSRRPRCRAWSPRPWRTPS